MSEPITQDGVGLIEAERQRQIVEEGWTPDHDQRHRAGELADAAACLAATEPIYVQRTQPSQGYRYSEGVRYVTPWPYESRMGRGELYYGPWRRSTAGDRIRDLVKAGALIAAEIDRLQRAERDHA